MVCTDLLLSIGPSRLNVLDESVGLLRGGSIRFGDLGQFYTGVDSRVLRGDPTVQNPTKRQIAERLGTPPHLINELIPPPSDAYLATLTQAFREANQHGWYEYDLASGTIAATPTTIECPPGTANEQQ